MAIFIALVLGYAACEYWRMFFNGGYNPSVFLLVSGVGTVVLTRKMIGFTGSDLVLTLIIFIAMGREIFQFERGRRSSAVDLGITLGGILYLGWLGSYLISLGELENGFWWICIALPAVGLTDGGAYFIGSNLGKHKMSQRVSPNKSWEGYIGGIIFGALGGMALAALWHLRAPEITYDKGLILGLAISSLSVLGDLGESMIKRNFNIKDSSNLLPGHGGIMDRIDSWLWAAPIGYYIITLLWL